jgi:Cu2+-exporting ATPase
MTRSQDAHNGHEHHEDHTGHAHMEDAASASKPATEPAKFADKTHADHDQHDAQSGHGMQQETPHTSVTAAPMDHSAHAQMQHTTHAGAASQDHDAHDEHKGHGSPDDMLRRFIISAIVTLPIVLFSPIGYALGFTLAPPFGLSEAWFGFILGTFVVLWGGWPFISSAWRALRHGEVNMMTLIALGILVAYGYSVAATFFLGGDVFFEAAAMLTTLSLLGHWLEMRSRFATGKAVEALLKLAPSTARVLRPSTDAQGELQEVEVPIEQVVVGDVIVIKPGDRVAVDGMVVSGSSYVDESMISG